MMIWAQQSQIHFRAAEFATDDDGKTEEECKKLIEDVLAE
jgi:hypothetical protein